MTVPTNGDFANCELSTEALEAIAAGWPHWLKTVVHDIGKVAEHIAPYVPFVVMGAVFVGGAFNSQTHYTSIGGYPIN